MRARVCEGCGGGPVWKNWGQACAALAQRTGRDFLSLKSKEQSAVVVARDTISLVDVASMWLLLFAATRTGKRVRQESQGQ
jgi:hypothetical protein